MAVTFSHVGICVSDLERSVRFYTEALGFERAEASQIGDDFARLMEVPRVRLTSQFLRRDQVALELLHFDEPPPEGRGERRPINRLGLTHLSVRVTDLEGTATRIVELGGRVVEETRTELSFGPSTLRFLYCTDPDGVRVELMDLGG